MHWMTGQPSGADTARKATAPAPSKKGGERDEGSELRFELCGERCGLWRRKRSRKPSQFCKSDSKIDTNYSRVAASFLWFVKVARTCASSILSHARPCRSSWPTDP